jgi:hypothetical protein
MELRALREAEEQIPYHLRTASPDLDWKTRFRIIAAKASRNNKNPNVHSKTVAPIRDELIKMGYVEGETQAARKKYHVKIFINSAFWHHSYSVFRYELPDAFDYIEDWAMKLLSQHRNRREGRRVRSDYGFVQEKERVPMRSIAGHMRR